MHVCQLIKPIFPLNSKTVTRNSPKKEWLGEEQKRRLSLICSLCHSGCSSASNSHQCTPQVLWEAVNSEPGPWGGCRGDGGRGVYRRMMNVLAQPTLCCSCSLQSFGTSSARRCSLWLCSSGCRCTPPASFSHRRNSQQKRARPRQTRIPFRFYLPLRLWCLLIKKSST